MTRAPGEKTLSPAHTLRARPVGPTWYPNCQSFWQPGGFLGTGFKPERMSQRRFAGDVEYAHAMLCDGVRRNTNLADALGVTTRANASTSRVIARR